MNRDDLVLEDKIKFPIRQMVEFILRSGDIDNRYVGRDLLWMGAAAHRKIQKGYGDAYTAEVHLKMDVPFEEYTVEMTGRADGVYRDDKGFVIDEIKTTMTPLFEIEENTYPLHWGQAMCYAYIYGTEHGADHMGIRLTYYHLETEEMVYYKRFYNMGQLKDFIHDLLEKYMFFGRLSKEWTQTRNASIQQTDFPFGKYRKGQRELAVNAYRTIVGSRNLFVEAPTGIGKTMSTIFPTVKAMGEGFVTKLFYLTAKTITRQVACEAFDRLQDKGLRFKVTSLTAKDKICFCEKTICNPDYCRYAKGHLDRINGAIRDLLESRQMNYTREVIEEYGQKHRVCPYELSLDMTLWSDGVVCDYNYAFDPTVYLRRFFSEDTNDYALLIDEAHNLVDRAREMFSASIEKSPFSFLEKAFQSENKQLAKAMGDINAFLRNVRKQCGDKGYLVQNERFEDLVPILNHFVAACDAYLKEHGDEGEETELLNAYFSVLGFLKIWDFYDERYVSFVETYGSEVILKLFCVDPSHLLSQTFQKCRSALVFSATLTPLSYYRTILGGKEDDRTMKLSSPFDENNLKLMVNGKISTRFIGREESYFPIARQIADFVQAKKGNYLVYFPSYQYMNEVLKLFHDNYGHIRTMAQHNGMSEADKENFLLRFDGSNAETLVGFAVLGGMFSEGIDLKGDRLIGTVIVGVGLPQINTQLDIIRRYFAKSEGKGYEYAYQYPGMNKVLQAAGRVIRSEEDKGAVLLIDDRFMTKSYTELYPVHWGRRTAVNSSEHLRRYLKDFWDH